MIASGLRVLRKGAGTMTSGGARCFLGWTGWENKVDNNQRWTIGLLVVILIAIIGSNWLG